MATRTCLRPAHFAEAYTDVGTLVAGPGVYICDECVALSSPAHCRQPKSVEPKSVPAHRPWEARPDLTRSWPASLE